MSRLLMTVRRIGAEAIGLVADDWRLPLGVVVILALGWWLVARGSGAAAVALVVVALAGFVLSLTVLDGRALLRRHARERVLDSTVGGRVPDRDR